jgi:hypothetical protein
MMQRLSDKNRNPDILAAVAGIGYVSPHGEALKEIAQAELEFIYNHLKSYTTDEQIFILDYISSELSGKTLELEEKL